VISINRRGVTRTVILTRRWAIKVPTIRGLGSPELKGMRIASFCRGVLANRTELEWSSVRGVNPVVWSYRGLVNVYRRADPVPEGSFQEDKDYEGLTEDFVPIGDRKPENIGIIDGRIVWIDYDYSWNGLRSLS
jgi:hypothetical protein